MKILLIGEYSNLHNSLKKGLVDLGHEVTLVSFGDGFKDFSSDIRLSRKKFSNSLSFLKFVFNFIFKYPYSFYVKSVKFQRVIDKLKGYDIVQLINEHAIGGLPTIEKFQIKRLKKTNGALFLLSSGDDFTSISYYMTSDKMKYSIMTPLLKDNKLNSKYSFSLKYLSKPFQKLSQRINNISNGIIASDFDYHLPLKNNPKYLGMIPNPVVLDKRIAKKKSNSNLRILLGINSTTYIKKGIRYFEDALSQIEEKYPEVDIQITRDLPFQKYLDQLNQCDILLDQVYAYDQGYNALEAMALGKVVFSGAEDEFLSHYNLEEDEVVINALPNVNYLVEKLSQLLGNPKKIIDIGKNAKAFIEKHHEATAIAKKYVDTWQQSISKSD
jgi:glycosyltransferase involved in cell wall biosynthesis